MMKIEQQKSKLRDKQDNNKKKLKRMNELNTQNKRQSTLLDLRVKENGQLKLDLA